MSPQIACVGFLFFMPKLRAFFLISFFLSPRNDLENDGDACWLNFRGKKCRSMIGQSIVIDYGELDSLYAHAESKTQYNLESIHGFIRPSLSLCPLCSSSVPTQFCGGLDRSAATTRAATMSRTFIDALDRSIILESQSIVPRNNALPRSSGPIFDNGNQCNFQPHS